MIYNPEDHHRRSIRLQGYDYSQQGAYFITLCLYARQCRLGRIQEGEMELNTLGCILEDDWLNTPTIRPGVDLDAFIIMPNHFHAIVILPLGNVPQTNSFNTTNPMPLKCPPRSLGALVGGFKASVTRKINNVMQTPDAPVWQRNYYEHIIRDEADLARIREYILYNPLRWTEDEENPERATLKS